MALADEVIARYPASRLKQLTNPNDQAASTVDTTVLGYAVADVIADFLTYCATTFDVTDSRHVSVAVKGVVATLALQTEAAGGNAQTDFDKYLDRLKDLARVTGRDRITPRTKSVLTPTAERLGTETVRPDTDRPDYEDLIPDAPR